MLGRVFERSLSRLFLVNCLTLAITLAISNWASETANVSVSGHWAEVVYFQIFFQLLTAALADYASGKASDQRGAALATLGLGLGALAALSAKAFTLWRSDPKAIETAANDTLLGAIFCTSNQDGCAVVYEAAMRGSLAWMAIVCIVGAWLLRRQLNGKGDVARGLSAQTLSVMAALGHSFVFLMVHAWEGVVSWRPLPAMSGPVTELSGNQQDLLAFQVSSTALIACACVLQAIGFWIALGIGRKEASPSNAAAQSLVQSVRSALLRSLASLLNLAFDILLLSVLLLIVGAIAIAAYWGVQSSILVGPILFSALANAVQIVATWMTQLVDIATALVPTFIAWALGFLILAVLAVTAAFAIWLGRVALKRGMTGAGQAIAALLGWMIGQTSSSLAHIPRIAARRAGFVIVAILAIAVLSLTLLLRPAADAGTAAADDPTERRVAPAFAAKHEFKRAEFDCAPQARGRELFWAFNSSDSIAIDTHACGLDFDGTPNTILVLGAASQDSTRIDGYLLSRRRVEHLAGLVQNQHPEATIVMAAMGRELGEGPTLFGQAQLYEYGRPIVMFASTADIPSPIKREPLSKTITELLKKHQLLDRYETCMLAIYGVSSINPVETPHSKGQNRCSWR